MIEIEGIGRKENKCTGYGQETEGDRDRRGNYRQIDGEYGNLVDVDGLLEAYAVDGRFKHFESYVMYVSIAGGALYFVNSSTLL